MRDKKSSKERKRALACLHEAGCRDACTCSTAHPPPALPPTPPVQRPSISRLPTGDAGGARMPAAWTVPGSNPPCTNAAQQEISPARLQCTKPKPPLPVTLSLNAHNAHPAKVPSIPQRLPACDRCCLAHLPLHMRTLGLCLPALPICINRLALAVSSMQRSQSMHWQEQATDGASRDVWIVACRASTRVHNGA